MAKRDYYEVLGEEKMSEPRAHPYDAHSRALEIERFSLEDVVTSGELEEYPSGPLVANMISDLLPLYDEAPYPVVSWGNVATRQLFKLGFDPDSGWTVLKRLSGFHEDAQQTEWYINFKERSTPYIRLPEVSDSGDGTALAFLWSSGSPKVLLEARLMLKDRIQQMNSDEMDQLAALLDPAFEKKLKAWD